MKLLRAVALIGLLAAPAFTPALAQIPNVNLIPDTPSKTPDQIEQEQAQQKAYKESLRKIPDAKGPADPWGNVRSSEAPKEAAKPEKRVTAKPKAKTGSSASNAN
jgi:hypothetical protein